MTAKPPEPTLSEKVWDRHVVHSRRGRARPPLHRSAPRARGHVAAGVRRAAPRRAAACAGPTSRSRRWTTTCRPPASTSPLEDPISAKQIGRARPELRGVRHPLLRDGRPAARASCTSSGPEQGLTQPGMTIVCGDSHTSTHGAFGALAFGIGTSEVEHVLATQTLPQMRPGTMAITVDGDAARRRHRQGHRARDHRPHRHRRRHRLGHRVPRRARSARSRWKAA